MGRALSLSSIREGEDLYFNCVADASPPPQSFLWFREVCLFSIFLNKTLNNVAFLCLNINCMSFYSLVVVRVVVQRYLRYGIRRKYKKSLKELVFLKTKLQSEQHDKLATITRNCYNSIDP